MKYDFFKVFTNTFKTQGAWVLDQVGILKDPNLLNYLMVVVGMLAFISLSFIYIKFVR